MGLTLTTAVPQTLGIGISLVRSCGGNEGLALMLTSEPRTRLLEDGWSAPSRLLGGVVEDAFVGEVVPPPTARAWESTPTGGCWPAPMPTDGCCPAPCARSRHQHCGNLHHAALAARAVCRHE